ncbi:hypothetical protein RUND412_003344 [Rhizina undulata]
MDLFMNNYGPAIPYNSSQANADSSSSITGTSAKVPTTNTAPPPMTPEVQEYYQMLSYESMQAFRKLHQRYDDLQTQLAQFKTRLTEIEESIEIMRIHFGIAETMEMRDNFRI